MQNNKIVSIRSFGQAVAVVIVVCCAVADVFAQPQPNIVFFFLDQLRAFETGAYGSPMISDPPSTPNIDLLAQQGIRFEYAFVGLPICGPSRACVQTGRLPASVRTTSSAPGDEWFTENQYNLNLSEVTIAEELNKYGYTCAHIGRWHLNTPNIDLPGPGDPYRQGYDYMEGINSWGGYTEARWYDNNGGYHSEPGRWLPESTTARAINFLNQQSGGPFYLQISLFPPHSRNDWQVDVAIEEMLTPAYMYLWDMYEYADVSFRPNVPASQYTFATAQCRKYHALTKGADELIGQVLDTLTTLGIAGNTIILVSSDHGEDMGSHDHFSKNRIYEESMRVPLIVYDPRNSPPQQIRTELISLMDLLPTFVELAGGTTTERAQGTSFAPLINGQGSYQPHQGILVQYETTQYPEGVIYGRTRAYRTQNWKLALMEMGRGTLNLAPKALFVLQNDPYEMNNLVDDPAYDVILDQLVQEAWAEMTQTEDSILIPADPPPCEPYVDLGSSNLSVGITLTAPGDGTTTAVNIGGRDARKNTSNYFYFDVIDTFVFGGNHPELYIIVEYYDTGSGSFTLQYDSNNGDEIADRYKTGDTVSLTNTNTWKQYAFHITDAYFGGRQNGSSDFRFATGGNTIYLDIVAVRKAPATCPNPQDGATGVGVTANIEWTAGGGVIWNKVYFGTTNPPPYIGQQTETIYNPGTLDVTTTYYWQIDTVTAGGTVNGEIWSFTSGSIPPDIDVDGDVDQEDFGLMQVCFSGTGNPFSEGCQVADFNQDSDVDQADFNLLQACMTGANVPVNPGCMQ
ncbi:MAG: sulfatase-like hydrolase/transferase [Planctomycetota bacterium]|nr:MAG: sulfatase-like hydrolase/transferase [Planctomycetota bacterium]